VNYYNEIDKYAAQWISNLAERELIPGGLVDDRSIHDVQAGDLEAYGQCHFFAGIAGWPLALELAGWPSTRPVWTGSCPCQKLSSAARGRNTAEDLWPEWFRLIAASRPRVLFGEQVASRRDWLDRLCDDLEPLGYEIGAAVLPSLSVGKDHIRHRLYFVGYAHGDGEPRRAVDAEAPRLSQRGRKPARVGKADGVSDRVAQLGAFGNAIDPQLAAQFISAFMTHPRSTPND